MRLPLTKYGLPQLLIYPLIAVLVALFLPVFFKLGAILITAEIILFLVFIWMLSFFRDPARKIKYDDDILYSPADGVIADISELNDSVLGPGVVRIGIFLSIFNVHINRVPSAVRVKSIVYKKGKFKNAFSSDAGMVNESNDILMTRLNKPEDNLLVRQISGSIARRIVCKAKEGDEYRQGEQFGMIKFSSRTELFFPAGHFKTISKIGDKVSAGITPLAGRLPGALQAAGKS